MTLKMGNILQFSASRPSRRQQVINDIFNDHAIALRRFLNVRLHSELDREDVIPDIFVRLSALPEIETYVGERPETFRGYLFTMAANLLRDRGRRAKVRHMGQHDSYDEKNAPHASASPEDFLSVKQNIGRMQEILLSLKPAHRHAFVLSRFKHRSNKDIAIQLDISVSTVEKHISKALLSLRKEFAK